MDANVWVRRHPATRWRQVTAAGPRPSGRSIAAAGLLLRGRSISSCTQQHKAGCAAGQLYGGRHRQFFFSAKLDYRNVKHPVAGISGEEKRLGPSQPRFFWAEDQNVTGAERWLVRLGFPTACTYTFTPLPGRIFSEDRSTEWVPAFTSARWVKLCPSLLLQTA